MWIYSQTQFHDFFLDKSLAEDDRSTLASHGINKSGQSIYLYLVAPKDAKEPAEMPNDTTNNEIGSRDQFDTKPEVPEGPPRKGK